jgi:DNA polymerase
MLTILLDGHGELAEWRDAARALLLAGIPPERVEWQLRAAATGDLFGGQTDGNPLPPPDPQAAAPTVPRAFLDLAEAVICHSDPARFALLYRLLWRMQGERHVLEMKADADVAQADRLEKSVRRDAHKMKAFVRFKELPDSAGQPRRRFLAWFEPDHFIVGRTAGFFQRRFTDMDWVIATPKGTSSWDGQQLRIDLAPAQKPELRDAADDLWRTYFAHIFNPARLKVKAMQSEMPKKYWKNLPEADLIPELIAGAEARVREMAERAASEPPAFHHRLRAREKGQG